MTMPNAEGPKKGLTREQLVEYFKRKFQDSDNKSELWKELYDKQDMTLVTETHAHMVIPKVRMKMIMHAIDPKRTESLIDLWLRDFNGEMVSFKRQGRLEGLGALQALETMEEEKTTKL